MYPAVYYRLITLLLLPGLLSGCSVYDHFFHPHRLGTPHMTAGAKAKAKAAEKARHKGLTLGTSETTNGDGSPATGSADGAAAPTAPLADTRSADDKNKAIAEMLGNTYDKKTGLLKRSKLQRMQYSSSALHHYDLHAPKHTDVAHDERKLRKYRKHPKGQADPGEPTARTSRREAAPDPTQPAPKAATAPAAKLPVAKPPLASRSTPDQPQAEKKSKKDRKAPKPDPTQPAGNQ